PTFPEPWPCNICFPAFAASLDDAAHEHLSAKCPEFYDSIMTIALHEPVLDGKQRMTLSATILAFQALGCRNCAGRPGEYVDIYASKENPAFDEVYNDCCITIAACLVPPEDVA
ncbi:hypothetical protein EXIGLDRAFT_729522, partial [Exidia glandulosa HHB12029]